METNTASFTWVGPFHALLVPELRAAVLARVRRRAVVWNPRCKVHLIFRLGQTLSCTTNQNQRSLINRGTYKVDTKNHSVHLLSFPVLWIFGEPASHELYPQQLPLMEKGRKKSSITIRSIKSKLYSWGMRMERAKVHGQLFRVSIITKQVQATCMDPTHTGICVCKIIPCIIRSLQGKKKLLARRPNRFSVRDR